MSIVLLAVLALSPAQPDKALVHLEGHKKNVQAVAVSKDGKEGYSIDGDGVLLTWDLVKRNLGSRVNLPVAQVYAFSPDGSRIALGLDGKISVRDRASTKEIAHVAIVKGLKYDNLALSDQGKRLLVGFDYGQVDVWDFSEKEPQRILKDDLVPAFVSLSRDGALLLAADDRGASACLRLAVGKDPVSLPLTRGGVGAASLHGGAIAPDGKELLALTDDKMARIRDTAKGTEIARFKGRAVWGFSSAAYSGDGKSLAINDRFARLILGTRDGKGAWGFQETRFEDLPLVSEKEEHMALSHDGTVGLITLDKTVVLWRKTP